MWGIWLHDIRQPTYSVSGDYRLSEDAWTVYRMTIGPYISYGIVSVTSFAIGATSGWLASESLNIGETDFRRFVAVAMLILYIISVLAEIRLGNYETPVLLHGLMGGVVGYLFHGGDGPAFNLNIGN